jgi:predicted NACHT family NTPase
LADLKCASAPELALRNLHERSGLIVERAIGRYGFAHLTFEEYFTALGLLKMRDWLAVLLEVFRKRNAQEVVLLYAGAAKNADDLIGALNAVFKRTRDVEHILLAGRAVAESESVSFQLRATIIERLNEIFDATGDEQVLLDIQSTLQRLGVNRYVIQHYRNLSSHRNLSRIRGTWVRRPVHGSWHLRRAFLIPEAQDVRD